jgi:transposase
MTMLADVVDAVVGIDTHRDTHTAQLVDPLCRAISEVTVPNTDAGFAELLSWIAAHQPGPRLVAAIEGSRSYGIGLARSLDRAGLRVIEVEQPKRTERRRGKSDPIDARLAARHALALPVDRLPAPRADGDREALRLLLTSRNELVLQQTQQTNRLHALLLTGDDLDRQAARGKFTLAKLAAITTRSTDPQSDRAAAVLRAEIRRLATAVRDRHRDLRANEHALTDIVRDLAPGLLDRPGIGPVSAATAIIAFSHPGRIRDDAAFAALAGTSPVPASSGRTVRHRLNRGGDRVLNRAMHTIARNRLNYDPATRAYAERRRAQGKTDREIIRCLKRYITRQIYRQLTHTMTAPA